MFIMVCSSWMQPTSWILSLCCMSRLAMGVLVTLFDHPVDVVLLARNHKLPQRSRLVSSAPLPAVVGLLWQNCTMPSLALPQFVKLGLVRGAPVARAAGNRSCYAYTERPGSAKTATQPW
mmetsp:Transcript_126420/g.328257  ORF Transcript_126420/g.328257 Transcript_126420/m.328257 type:complete len:120 (+) Transcript_126420:1481-1840(+)